MIPPVMQQYLALTDLQLRAVGLDLRQRIHECGHRRSLTPWLVPTVGMWGLASQEEIMAVADLSSERQHTYDKGMYRWGLRDGRVARAKGWSAPRIWLHAWARIRLHVQRTGESAGSAAWAQHVSWQRPNGPGILPVEALLYYWEVRAILDHIGESERKWAAMRERDRIARWTSLELNISLL